MAKAKVKTETKGKQKTKTRPKTSQLNFAAKIFWFEDM